MSSIAQLVRTLADRPDYWLLVFWPVFFSALWLLSRWPGTRKLLSLTGKFWILAGGLTLAAFIWFNWVYLRSPMFPGMFFHIQPDVATVSWYFAEGKPVYHGPESAEVYNIVYGPYLYIFTGFIEKILGPSLFSAKLGGQLALYGATLVFAFILRKRLGWARAILAVGIFTAMVVNFDPIETYTRADSFIVLFVVLGAWAAYSPSKIAPWILGLAIGVSTELKIHAGVYFLPLLWLAWRSGYRGRSWLVAGGCALTSAILPFVAFSNISLRNYLWTLAVASHHGLSAHYYLPTLEYFFALCAPIAIAVILAYIQQPGKTMEILKSRRCFIGLILVEFLLVLPFASKFGAGPHHLLPMVIVLLLLAVELHEAGLRFDWSGSPVEAAGYALLYSWLACCLGFGFMRSYQNAAWMNGRTEWAKSVTADVEKIRQTYQSSHVLLMGAGNKEHYELTFYRTGLIFQGEPIGIDPSALMEFSYAGYPTITLSKLTAFLNQNYPHKKILWLIPKGDEPFSMDSFYSNVVNGEFGEHKPLYDDSFRADFKNAFKLQESTSNYDLYAN